MLQWMGGSRKKVSTSRRSTQKRQKQYFEQRKRREQQQTDSRESYFEGRNLQQEKTGRSLDILSLLNLSTGSGEHKASDDSARRKYEGNDLTPHNQMSHCSPARQTNEVIRIAPLQHKEGTSPRYQVYEAYQKNASVGAPGGHENALCETDDKVNPLKISTGSQLSIIDLLGDDEPSSKLESSTHEGHVAFSIEGLGKVETSTPVHSPKVPGRAFSYGSSSPARAKRKAISFNYLNRGTDGHFDHKLDSMMVDVELPFCTSPVNQSTCSRGVTDVLGSVEQKLLDTEWFSHRNTNFTDLYSFEHDEFFGSNKETSDTIWNSKSSLLQRDSFHEDCGSPGKNWVCPDDAGSADFWSIQNCGMQDVKFESSYYRDPANYISTLNCGNQGTYFERSYHQKQRASMKAQSEFKIIDSSAPYAKHLKSENLRDFSVSDKEWCSMGRKNSNYMDYVDHRERPWFANEDATDNLSLLSEESCSSTAVKGDLDTQSVMNSNNKRRMGMSDGSKETKFCENLFVKGRKCNANSTLLGQEVDEPTKLPQALDHSNAKTAHYLHDLREKRLDLNNDGSWEARCDPGESNSSFIPYHQTSGSKKHGTSCSDLLFRDVLCASPEPKSRTSSLQSFKRSSKHPGENKSSCFMSEKPMTFELDSPSCTYANLFQDSMKDCGPADSLQTLTSLGTVKESLVRNVGKRPDFLRDGDTSVDVLPFCSGQFDTQMEVPGGCNGLSSGKGTSMDASGSVDECSNCEEPKDKTPEVDDRTKPFNYSESTEETSPSIEISTVLKGDQDCSDKNREAQASVRCLSGDEVTNADSASPSKRRIIKRETRNVDQNGQVMMLEAVSFNLFVCRF